MAGLLVFTTTPDLESARRLARSLVRNKLAACVSVKGGFASFFRWKGRLEKAPEALVLIKTVKAKFPALSKFIRSNHAYEIPEVVGLPMTHGSREYLLWMHRVLK